MRDIARTIYDAATFVVAFAIIGLGVGVFFAAIIAVPVWLLGTCL